MAICNYAVGSDWGDTWYGNQVGVSSRIDVIALPSQLVEMQVAAGPLERMGRRLQLIPSQHHRDHVPVFAKVPFVRPKHARDQEDAG
eukprot:14004114-Alexandrium_andersonii.AAC.1